MGVRQAGAIARTLMQRSRAADLAAVIEAATTPRQRVIPPAGPTGRGGGETRPPGLAGDWPGAGGAMN